MSTRDTKELTTKDYTLSQWLQSDKFKRNLMEIMQTEEAVRRFVQIGLNVIKRNEKLNQCTQASVLDCLLKLSQINLEPDGYHAHLVPFNNKIKWRDDQGKWQERWELQAQLIIDYKGLVSVVRRDPMVAVLKGNVVYSKDQFTYDEGSERRFYHHPTFQARDKSNPIVFVYSFIKWKDGDWDVEILTVDEVERVRQMSRAKDSGPWVDFWGEMAIKTAIRKLCKRLPLKPEQREAITADDDQYQYENPFERKQPVLTYLRPEFRSETQPDTHDNNKEVLREPATDQRSVVDPDESRKRDSKPRAETPQATAKPGPAKDEPQEPAKASERGYQYGPGDEQSSDQEEPTKEGSTSSGPDANRGSGSDLPELSEHDPVPTKEPSKALQKLLAQINKEKVTQDEVIRVLLDHDQSVGDAENTGLVVDLPETTLELAVKNFGSIIFGVKKIRRQQQT
ncbi:MAG TPA: recombinase RecT [Chthoniobacterales bacterium]|nr:recombinase RecT [Chthoniobacterales bacterium]